MLRVKRERALQIKSKVEYLNVYKSFLIWFAAFPRAAICISELACFFCFLFRLVKAAAANRGAPVPNVHPWGISGRAHLSSFYFTACRQLCIFSDSKIHFFSPIFLRTKSWPFDIWCSNLLFCFIWHTFWDWVNRLQMFTLFYIPAGSSVHPKSVFSHNSFCCWQHFFWWIMGLDVSLATRHRRCFSNWLIEFIIRYWKREKASKTSAKADWSQKLCSLCKMHKRRFSNWASPHFLAVPRPKYGGWWILGKSGNCANPAKSPTATKTLQSCWLHSTDCYRNIQNGRRLSFLL